MVDIAASIGIKAGMDMSDVERGKSKITSLFDESKRKAKETNVFLSRTTGLLKGLTKFSAAFGAGLIASLTGIVAMSPQFKVMFEKLKPILFNLGRYMGSKLQPLFDAIVESAGYFADKFMELDKKHNILGKISDGGIDLLDTLKKISSDGTLDKIIGMTSKVVELTQKVLFGDEDSKGLFNILKNMGGFAGEIIKIPLEMAVSMIGLDNTIKAAMVGAAYMMGGPAAGTALFTAFALEAGYTGITEGTKEYHEGQKELAGVMESYGGVGGFMKSELPSDAKFIGTLLYSLNALVDEISRVGVGAIPGVVSPSISSGNTPQQVHVTIDASEIEQ